VSCCCLYSLLAAYDFGAPTALLQAIYDSEKVSLEHIHTANSTNHIIERQDVQVTQKNWKDFLQRRAYV
jgi:hypothetical protein